MPGQEGEGHPRQLSMFLTGSLVGAAGYDETTCLCVTGKVLTLSAGFALKAISSACQTLA